MKIEYAVALLTMKGNRMAQESNQSHLRFRTYARRKNGLLLILIMSMMMMNVQIVFTFLKYEYRGGRDSYEKEIN